MKGAYVSGLILKEVGTALAAPTALTDGQVRFETRIMGGDIQGSSGYYPKEVIERDGPGVFAKGTHMHIDHQSFMQFWEQPAGSLNDLAAIIDSTPKWENDHPSGPGLYAEVKVFKKYAAFLSEIAPYIGVSIRAAALSEEGESPATGEMTEVITKLVAAVSVDFVTHPGADGRIVKVLEGAKNVLPEGTKLIAHTNESQVVPAIEAGTPPKGKKKPMAELTEEAAKALESAISGLTAALTSQEATRQAAEAAATKAAEDAGKVDVENVIAEATNALVESGLPAKARERVLKAVKSGDNIAEAIKAEQDYLAEVGSSDTAGFHIQETGSSAGSSSTATKLPWVTAEAVTMPKGVLDLVARYTGKAS